MLNRFIFLLLVFFIGFAYSSADENDTYVFEAKGKFAKELKSLIEKYSKDGIINAKVYVKSNEHKEDGILGSIFSKDYRKVDGKKLYTNLCSSCHGKSGSKIASPDSQPISNMSKDNFIFALRSYKTDTNYGKTNKMLMNSVVSRLRSRDFEAIYNYLSKEN